MRDGSWPESNNGNMICRLVTCIVLSLTIGCSEQRQAEVVLSRAYPGARLSGVTVGRDSIGKYYCGVVTWPALTAPPPPARVIVFADVQRQPLLDPGFKSLAEPEGSEFDATWKRKCSTAGKD